MKSYLVPVPDPEVDPDGFVSAVNFNLAQVEAAMENAVFRTGDTMDADIVMSGGVVGNGRIVDGTPEALPLFGRWSTYVPLEFMTTPNESINLGNGDIPVWETPGPISWAGGWADIEAAYIALSAPSEGGIYMKIPGYLYDLIGTATGSGSVSFNIPDAWLPEGLSPILPGTISTWRIYPQETVTDDGAGGFLQEGTPIIGAVDYDTGVMSFVTIDDMLHDSNPSIVMHLPVLSEDTAPLGETVTVYFYREDYDGDFYSGDLTLTTWINGVRTTDTVPDTDVQSGSFVISVPPGTTSLTFDLWGTTVCGIEQVLVSTEQPIE